MHNDSMPNPVPGTIGHYASRRIKTKQGLISKALEHKARMETKWRGPARRGGGYAADVTPPVTWRATTKQSCGLYPFPLGNRAPKVGAPMGVHYDSREAIGCDMLSWFLAEMIQNPSVAWMSNPAAGKSTAMRVMMEGLIAHGVVNLVVGDQKDEHGEFMEYHGGNRVSVGGGRGTINPLDPGPFGQAMARVREALGDSAKGLRLQAELLSDFHSRRADTVGSLVSIHRGAPVSGVEDTVVQVALREMYDARPHRVPILDDLLDYLTDPTDGLLKVTCPRKDLSREEKVTRYFARMDDLLTDLAAVCGSGTFGEMFNGPTRLRKKDGTLTSLTDYSHGLTFDISGIDANQPKLISAAYLVTWAVAFGIINTAHALADAGLEPRRQFVVWLDEFWQPLIASKGMVDRANRLIRLNRTVGTGVAYAIHTLNDLEALPDEEDRSKARGLLKKCGMQWFGGLPYEEVMQIHTKLTRLKDTEIEQLVQWNNPAFKEQTGLIPGRGCFLIKMGEETGIPVRVTLTETERRLGLHDTSKRMSEDPTTDETE